MQTVFRSSPFLQSRRSGRVAVVPLALRSDWISISDDPVELEEWDETHQRLRRSPSGRQFEYDSRWLTWWCGGGAHAFPSRTWSNRKDLFSISHRQVFQNKIKLRVGHLGHIINIGASHCALSERLPTWLPNFRSVDRFHEDQGAEHAQSLLTEKTKQAL